MKTSFLFLFILIANISLAQKKFVDARVIFEGSDKIDSVQIQLFQFPSGTIEPLYLNKKIRVLKNGKSTKIKESEFYMIEFHDGNRKKRSFYSEKALGFQNPKKNLVEVIYEGRISWYRDYKPDQSSYSGGMYSSFGLSGALINSSYKSLEDRDTFIKKEEGVQGKTLFAVKLMTRDREDLQFRLKNLDSPYDLIRVLKDYDLGLEMTNERLKKDNMNHRISFLNEIQNLDTVIIEYPDQLKVDTNLLYKGASGDVFAVANEDGSGRFVEIRYLSSDGQTRTSRVQIKDVRIIMNKIE